MARSTPDSGCGAGLAAVARSPGLAMPGPADLPRIVHLSGDFPDPFEPTKTPVIRSLLELTLAQFSHRVISINRRTPRLADMIRGAGDQRAAFDWGEARIYRAPPSGLFHATMLGRLGAQLAEELASAPPALLVGHKLTIEGLAVAKAAQCLQVPYAITIQGNSDTRILAARPDLRRDFARVFHDAAVVFAFAPWALDAVEKLLGKRSGTSLLLPCPTDLDTPLTPQDAGEGLLSVFHLRHYRNKNLAGIAAALRLLRADGEATGFFLLGGGSAAELRQCGEKLAGIPDACVAGTLDREGLRRALNGAIGFVLPSHRESFGLVFIEALFAGLPVIYPENRAIAGWFDHLPFAIAVDPRNPQALAGAMKRLIREEKSLKQALADWQTSPHASQFARPHIAARFAAGLLEACALPDARLQKLAE